MNKICTSIEQSQKLIELEIDVNTADMYYYPYPNDEGWYDIPNVGEARISINELSAWSLSALLEIIRNHDRHELYLYEGGYYFECGEFMTESYFNPIDAAFEMVCWLKENGHILEE